MILRAACFEGRLNIVNILCEHGADLDKVSEMIIVQDLFKAH